MLPLNELIRNLIVPDFTTQDALSFEWTNIAMFATSLAGYKVSQCSKQCSSIISSPKLVVVHFNHATQVYCNDFACYLSRFDRKKKHYNTLAIYLFEKTSE